MNNDYKFRASHTVLNTWASGNWERAIKQYFKLEKFITPAMAEGKEYHKKWEDHVNKHKMIPYEFGSAKLNKPQAELKLVVQLADWLELVGVIDCYDEPTIYDWKTGKQSSESYASSKQPGVYGLIAKVSNMPVDRAIIWRYDQYTKKSDMSQIWITPELITEAYNWVETLASEMHNYFITNKLYEKFS